jgi:hypothetical protein
MKKLLSSPIASTLVTALIIAAVGFCWHVNAVVEVHEEKFRGVEKYMVMIWDKLEQIDRKCEGK